MMTTTQIQRPQPYSLWGLFFTTLFALILFATVGVVTQLLNIGFGLWFTEAWIFLGVAWIALRRRGYTPFHDMGLLSGGLREVVIGLVLGGLNYFVVVVPISFAAETIADRVAPGLGKAFSIRGLFNHLTPATQLVLVAGAVIAAPFAEELFFRGLLLRRAIAHGARPWRALIVISAVFSAFHFDPVGFTARFEIGLLLGHVFLRSGSLKTSMSVHAITNAVACSLLFLLKGQPQDSPEIPHSLMYSAIALVIGLLAAVGVFKLASRLLPNRWATEAVDAPPQPRVSWTRLASVWVVSAIVVSTVFVALDLTGVKLSLIDVRYPLRAKGESLELKRDDLDQLRRDVLDGKLPISTYTTRRRELAH